MLKFDKPVSLLNGELFQQTIDNTFTNFILKATQLDEQSILIETNYIVKPESVPASKAENVALVFRAIKNLDESFLIVKTK